MRRVAYALGLLAAVGLALTAPSVPAATAGSSCPGRFTVGNLHGINLTASRIRARDMTCRAARRLARAYLTKKVYGHPIEQYATEATTDEGCKVDGFTCHAGRRQICAAGRRSVSFSEYDADNG